MTVRKGVVSFEDAQVSLRRMVGGRRERVEAICRKHGAIIEVKAAAITPVDKGFLRRANEYKVDTFYGATFLQIENRMSYAAYQHNYPHRHTQPNARDHFIALPFAAELPLLVDDIIGADMEAVQ